MEYMVKPSRRVRSFPTTTQKITLSGVNGRFDSSLGTNFVSKLSEKAKHGLHVVATGQTQEQQQKMSQWG